MPNNTSIRRAVALGLLLTATVALGAGTSSFKVSSPDLPPPTVPEKAFSDNLIADAFGCKGGNESPALEWTGAPAGTKSFAITMFDYFQPPASGWWHWVVYDIPGTSKGLPHGAGSVGGKGMPGAAVQVKPDGDAPEPHYYGPCPDPAEGVHRYVITVYALSVDKLDVPATSTLANIDYLIGSKALAKASIERRFHREK